MLKPKQVFEDQTYNFLFLAAEMVDSLLLVHKKFLEKFPCRVGFFLVYYRLNLLLSSLSKILKSISKDKTRL